jgi:DNA-directed RNA polymerase subunit H
MKKTHILIPEHAKLSVEEKKALLQKYNITPTDLPKIHMTDPAIQHLKVKEGDIIKITRKSPTAGRAVFYRAVIL